MELQIPSRHARPDIKDLTPGDSGVSLPEGNRVIHGPVCPGHYFQPHVCVKQITNLKKEFEAGNRVAFIGRSGDGPGTLQDQIYTFQ